MNFKYRVSPSIKTRRTTLQIMNELTLALLAVLVFTLVYYGTEYGLSYVVHALTLLGASLATSLIIEFAWAKFYKKDVKKFLLSSYPWVTVLILFFTLSINTSVYAMVIGTFVAIVLGKLLYGGFGHNIFNPAAVGRAVMLTAFGARTVADMSTSATPISSVNAQAWAIAPGGFDVFVEQFGGLTGLLTGWHPGAMGETSFLLLLVIGVVLVIREVIDWRIPVFYIGTIFGITTIIAVASGMDLIYGVFHVITGGAMFAAVFMLTDPVTSPLHPVGRAIYASGAGFITVLIRLLANTPGGVLFSILIMNMLVPLIDYLLAGNLIKVQKKALSSLAILLVVFGLTSLLIGNSMKEAVASTLKDDKLFVVNEKEEGSSKVYTIESNGFANGVNNVITVTITDGKVDKVVFDKNVDSEGYSDPATKPDFLDSFKGLSDVSTVDTSTGATFTSKSVQKAVQLALDTFGGK